jgi:hypothetical protein
MIKTNRSSPLCQGWHRKPRPSHHGRRSFHSRARLRGGGVHELHGGEQSRRDSPLPIGQSLERALFAMVSQPTASVANLLIMIVPSTEDRERTGRGNIRTERKRDRDRDRSRERDKAERDRGRDRERERQRDETERDRQRARQRQTERARQRERETHLILVMVLFSIQLGDHKI